MLVRITRRRLNSTESYVQDFSYDPQDEKETVASMLKKLNEDPELKDNEGNRAEKIAYKQSCLQKKCGACAMLINGRPRLACSTLLKDCGEILTLEPLKKFRVIEDLIVDRSVMKENLKTMEVYFEQDALVTEKRNQLSYEASRCLQCGCCLEVCPNFEPGGGFNGMAGALPLSRKLNELKKEDLKEASKLYREYIYEGCGKSLACENICPAGIKIADLLVNSNAIAVWKRYLKD